MNCERNVAILHNRKRTIVNGICEGTARDVERSHAGGFVSVPHRAVKFTGGS
jgi:hypothetical protein